MVVHAGSGKPAKHHYIRPLTLLLIPLLFFLLGGGLGYLYLPQSIQVDVRPVHDPFTEQLSQAHTRIATLEAENALKEAQINSLQTMLQQQQTDISQLKQRINLFNSLLQARKGHYTQIIQALVKKNSPREISFNIALVKGGNYPRNITGTIEFSLHDQQGKSIPLRFDSGAAQLPYGMETHTFLQGTLHTEEDTTLPSKPSIDLIVYNHKGVEITRKACQFEDQPS